MSSIQTLKLCSQQTRNRLIRTVELIDERVRFCQVSDLWEIENTDYAKEAQLATIGV
jgi:hypothetical protein